MNAMMLSCVKATQLMEIKEVAPLGFINEMQLRIHRAMCWGCKNYRKQTALINKLLKKTFSSAPPADTTELEKATVFKFHNHLSGKVTIYD